MTKNLSRFHWQIAGVAFVLYALTLSHGVTLASLSLASKVAGWDWLPLANRPLTWLLTLPLHLLPSGWIPVALNLFSAGIAALTLGVLARSVELLPWSSEPDENKIWSARLPALLACGVCGLELNFWQDATAATGELVELLLLAASVRCLLEFRVEKEVRWLNRAAMLWGMGMAENWLMLVTLPLFLAALLALRRMKFFKLRFLLRMGLLGLAGFSLAALLPMVNGLDPHSPWTFVEAWSVAWRSTKRIFSTLYYTFWSWHRLLAAAVVLYFLVPLLPCFVRLKNETAHNKSKVDRFQVWIFRALRVVLLLACLWLAFDPEVGPRQIVRKQLGVELPLLTFDYVNALGIAFLAGSLVFAAQVQPLRRARSALQKFNSTLRRNTMTTFAVITMTVSFALLIRNLPTVLAVNRHPLSGYGDFLARSLPAGGGLVLSEDGTKLAVLRAAWSNQADRQKWSAVNLQALPSHRYRAALERETPRGWLTIGPDRELKLNELLQLLNQLERTNRMFFIAPHSGVMLFELFQPTPLAAVSELKRHEETHFARPQLTAQRLADNENFWDGAWRGGLETLSQPPGRSSKLVVFLHRRLALSPPTDDQQQKLRVWYSAAFNDWGVVLQRAGDLLAAQRRFEQARALNTNNLAATVNWNCNSNLLAGQAPSTSGAGRLADKFRSIQEIAAVVAVHGAFDDPAIACVIGNACFAAGWPRQSWAEFDRARELATNSIIPELALARIYARVLFDDEVLATVSRVRAKTAGQPMGKALESELVVLEAGSWIARTNPAAAVKALESYLQKNPGDNQAAELVFKTYLQFGWTTNALQIVDEQLTANADNLSALNNRAALLIQLGRAAEALPTLDRALALTNLPSIRLNRAIARLQVGDNAAAEKDYALVENSPAVEAFTVHFGLAQLAVNRRDTNAAVRQLEICLTNVVPDSVRWRVANERLTALKNPAVR